MANVLHSGVKVSEFELQKFVQFELKKYAGSNSRYKRVWTPEAGPVSTSDVRVQTLDVGLVWALEVSEFELQK